MTEELNKNKENPVVDMLLSHNVEETIDSESMILETQKRVWGALKKGYEYSGVVDESERYLRKHVFVTKNTLLSPNGLISVQNRFHRCPRCSRNPIDLCSRQARGFLCRALASPLPRQFHRLQRR